MSGKRAKVIRKETTRFLNDSGIAYDFEFRDHVGEIHHKFYQMAKKAYYRQRRQGISCAALFGPVAK